MGGSSGAAGSARSVSPGGSQQLAGVVPRLRGGRFLRNLMRRGAFARFAGLRLILLLVARASQGPRRLGDGKCPLPINRNLGNRLLLAAAQSGLVIHIHDGPRLLRLVNQVAQLTL